MDVNILLLAAVALIIIGRCLLALGDYIDRRLYRAEQEARETIRQRTTKVRKI